MVVMMGMMGRDKDRREVMGGRRHRKLLLGILGIGGDLEGRGVDGGMGELGLEGEELGRGGSLGWWLRGWWLGEPCFD